MSETPVLRSSPEVRPLVNCLTLVDLDEVQVVVGDLLGRGLAIESVVEESAERVPPDRAPDRKPDEALDRRRLTEPLLDLLGRSAAPEQHARDALAALAGASLLGEHRRV